MLDITGVDGDLEIRNEKSFGNRDDNRIYGARGSEGPLNALAVPARYHTLPKSTLDASGLGVVFSTAATEPLEVAVGPSG